MQTNTITKEDKIQNGGWRHWWQRRLSAYVDAEGGHFKLEIFSPYFNAFTKKLQHSYEKALFSDSALWCTNTCII